MAFLDPRVSQAGQQTIYFVTTGASDLPTTGDFFKIGDWVVNLNQTVAVGDPAYWVVTSLGTGSNAPTFTAGGYVGSNPINTLTTSTTITTSYRTVLANATSAGFKITLPSAAAANKGFSTIIIKSDTTTNMVTVTPAGSNTINGQTGDYILYTGYQTLNITSDGSSGWDRTSGTGPTATRAAASATTVGPSDRYLLVSAGAAITLPAATSFPVGQAITVKNTGVVNSVVTPAQGNIDGYAAATINPYVSVGYITDGSNYYSVTQPSNYGIRIATIATTGATAGSTVAVTDRIVLFSGAGVAALPSASTWPSGYIVTLKSQAASVTVTSNGGTILTSAAQTTLTTLAGYVALQLSTDPTNTSWISVG